MFGKKSVGELMLSGLAASLRAELPVQKLARESTPLSLLVLRVTLNISADTSRRFKVVRVFDINLPHKTRWIEL
jgi:hypothetical protein